LSFCPAAPASPVVNSAVPSEKPPTVRFRDVGLRYGRSPEILRDISFDLEPGSFHFLTGASGAGKSSLLKLIYLANRPTRGQVQIFGQDAQRMRPKDLPGLRRRIGVVFQEIYLMEHLNVFDNTVLPLRISGQKPQDYRNDAAELLNWVGLGRRMDAMPETLSGGERQRLAIARAVVGRPSIVLADEPTGNVDHEMGLRILRLLVELNRLGTTILIASHDQDLVARSGMPVMHLDAGRLSHSQPPFQPDLGAEPMGAGDI